VAISVSFEGNWSVGIGPELRVQRAKPSPWKPDGLDCPADEGENDQREPDRDEQQASASH